MKDRKDKKIKQEKIKIIFDRCYFIPNIVIRQLIFHIKINFIIVPKFILKFRHNDEV